MSMSAEEFIAKGDEILKRNRPPIASFLILVGVLAATGSAMISEFQHPARAPAQAIETPNPNDYRAPSVIYKPGRVVQLRYGQVRARNTPYDTFIKMKWNEGDESEHMAKNFHIVVRGLPLTVVESKGSMHVCVQPVQGGCWIKYSDLVAD